MTRVTCAIIVKDGRVLAARRGAGMNQGGLWEFPGGKVRDGESDEASLVREIREELGLAVLPTGRLEERAHTYDEDRKIVLVPFVCSVLRGELKPVEHSESRWCARDELEGLDWCPADLPVVRQAVAQWMHLANSKEAI